MARKAGPSGGATQSGQRPAVGQDPAPEGQTPEPAGGPSPQTEILPEGPGAADGPAASASGEGGASGLGMGPAEGPTRPPYGEPKAQQVDGGPGDIPAAPEPAASGAPGTEAPAFTEQESGASEAEGIRAGQPLDEIQPLRSEPPTAAYEYPSTPPADPVARRGGVGSLLLGGMMAAGLGFGAAYLARDSFGPAPAAVPAELEERLAAIEARPAPDDDALEALAVRLSEAEARLAALEEVPETAGEPVQPLDLGPLREEVEQSAAEAQAEIAALEERLAALEARPVPSADPATLGSLAAEPGPALQATPAGGAPAEDALAVVEPRLAQAESGLSEVRAGVAANGEAIEALGSRVDEIQTGLQAIDARLAEAEAASAAAAERAGAAEAALAETEARTAAAESQAQAGAALARIDDALDEGLPFAEALSELEAAGTQAPQGLSAYAASGAPSLAAVRQAFPEAARAGLAAAREQGLLEEGGGISGFLSSQLSLRSTAPREGTDPDAVLSRAESALAQGRLDAALAEIDALPQSVRDAMGDWIPQARARAEAVAALAALRGAEPDAAPAD